MPGKLSLEENEFAIYVNFASFLVISLKLKYFRRSSQVVSQRVDWNSSSDFNFHSSIYSPLKIPRQTERESINFPQLKGKRKARKCAKTRGGLRLDHSNSLFSQRRRKFSRIFPIGRNTFLTYTSAPTFFPLVNFAFMMMKRALK